MSERFDSKLADVESPLVRQLGRYLRWSNVDTGLLKRPKGDWDRRTCGYLPKGVISCTAVLIPRQSDNVESVHSCLGWNRTEVVDFLWLVHFFLGEAWVKWLGYGLYDLGTVVWFPLESADISFLQSVQTVFWDKSSPSSLCDGGCFLVD